MIITTTPTIEGKRITEYKGIVFGEVVSGVNFVKDFAAGLTNFFGGRSGSYEGELIEARENALREMEQRASQMGANRHRVKCADARRAAFREAKSAEPSSAWILIMRCWGKAAIC